MSRFLISKSASSFNKIAKQFDEHFERAQYGGFLDCIYSTWHKSSIKEPGFTCRESGSAFYTGTLEYNGKVGIDALNEIFESFTESTFPSILKKTTGCFSVVINKFDKIYLFVDPLATFKSYYLESDVGISNNMYALACAYSSQLEINKTALIEQSFQYSVIGPETILKGVNKLQSGDLYIYSEGSGFEIKDHDIFNDNSCKKGSVAQDLLDAANNICDCYDSVSVNMTGGLDSRLVLSSFLAARSKPNLVYGKGNSSATNTKTTDEEIVYNFSSEFNLAHYNMDWSLPDKFIGDWDDLLSKYGEYFTVYCGNKRLIEQYEELVPSFSKYTCFGYFGETFRNVERLESSKKDSFDVGGLVEDFYLYHGADYTFLGDFEDEYRKSIIDKISLICNKEGLAKSKLTKDQFQVIHNSYRSEADSKMCGFVNSIMYSSVFLSTYNVQCKVRNVPFSDKKAAHYQLGIIYGLMPEALKIPLFSHGKRYAINTDSLSIATVFSTTSCKSIIKNTPIVGAIAKKLKRFLRKKHQRPLHSSQYLGCYSRAWLNNRVVELQDVLGISLVNPERFCGDIRALVYYIMYLYLLINVFKKEYQFPPIED